MLIVLPGQTERMMLEETDYEWILVVDWEDDTCYVQKQLTPEGLIKLLKDDHVLS